MRIRRLGLVDYATTFEAMRSFTRGRAADTPDELWLLEHHPVFTQGQAGKPEHLLMAGDIPVVQSDRGGQITYHGPGQLVAYPLIDIARRGYGVRGLVTRLENAIISTLAGYSIAAYADRSAPGVYVDIAGLRHKIGSLGLRVTSGRSYHGLSLNVNMDLEPFGRINPCGYKGLQMTQIAAVGGPAAVAVVAEALTEQLKTYLADTDTEFAKQWVREASVRPAPTGRLPEPGSD